MSAELAAFLRARLEGTRTAAAELAEVFIVDDRAPALGYQVRAIAENQIAACQASLAIVDQWEATQPPASASDHEVADNLEITMELLASPYVEHPDYDPDWWPSELDAHPVEDFRYPSPASRPDSGLHVTPDRPASAGEALNCPTCGEGVQTLAYDPVRAYPCGHGPFPDDIDAWRPLLDHVRDRAHRARRLVQEARDAPPTPYEDALSEVLETGRTTIGDVTLDWTGSDPAAPAAADLADLADRVPTPVLDASPEIGWSFEDLPESGPIKAGDRIEERDRDGNLIQTWIVGEPKRVRPEIPDDLEFTATLTPAQLTADHSAGLPPPTFVSVTEEPPDEPHPDEPVFVVEEVHAPEDLEDCIPALPASFVASWGVPGMFDLPLDRW